MRCSLAGISVLLGALLNKCSTSQQIQRDYICILGWIAAQGLAALGLEPAESRAVLPLRARLRSRARDAAPDANPGLLGALLNGVVGILSEPVR